MFRMGGVKQKMPVNPMQSAHNAPRCKAKSKRSGKRCKAPAVRGKAVCRMHGAKAGAPTGPAHGRYVHGERTGAVERLRFLAQLLSR